MARTAITATDLAKTGYNLTDSAHFTTLSAGAGNGVEVPFDANKRIFLKNDTGGASTWTVKIPTSQSHVDIGVTFPDMTISIANGKTWILEPQSPFRQASGTIYIDCSVAGKVLLL